MSAFKALFASVLAPKVSPLEEAVSWAIQKNDIKSLNYWCAKGSFKPLLQISELITEAQEIKRQNDERRKQEETTESKSETTESKSEEEKKSTDETEDDSSSSSSADSSSSASSASSSSETNDVSDVALSDNNSVPSLGSEGCVDVHFFTVQGLPMSHYSAKHDRPLVLRFLVKICGADVNQTDSKGWTPLHYASAQGVLRTLSELLDLGANPLSRTDQGLLPSQVSTNGHVRYMLSALVSARSAGLHYRLTCVGSAKVDEPIKIKYICPLQHSEKDHIAICYVGEQPWMLNKRLGTDKPIPVGSTSGQIILSTSQPGPYRIVYIDGVTGVFVAASDICYVFPKPAVQSIYSRRPLEPKVVLHPQFRLLTDNSEDFKLPVPAYFNLNFQLNPRAIQIALQVDPALAKIRLDLVPTYLEDDEFWKNYFYRMVLLDTSSSGSSSLNSSKYELKETKSSISSSSSTSESSSSISSSPSKAFGSIAQEKLSSDTSVITEVVYTEL